MTYALPRFVCTVLLLTFCACHGVSRVEAQQRFELDVPGDPTLHSKAVVDGVTLSITGPNGGLTVYNRSPAHDTPGYTAYLWPQGRQFVRFPQTSGPMFTSSNGLSWRRSRMLVSSVGPAIVAPVPGAGGFGMPGAIGVPGALGGASAGGTCHLDVIPVGTGLVVSRIDQAGTLEFWRGGDVPWRRIGQYPSPRLVAGAPVRMVVRAGATLPTVFTVSAAGELLQVINGANVTALSPATPAQYSTNTHLAIGGTLTNKYVLGVQRPGTFFHLRDDGTAGTGNFGQVAGGIPMCAMGATANQLFFVDYYGKLRGVTVGTWAANLQVLTLPPDFQPGAHVSGVMAVPAGAAVQTTHVATVNKLGQLQLVFDNGLGVWQAQNVGTARLVPGQPVCLSESGAVFRIAYCGATGELVEVTGRPGAPWTVQTVASGFPPLAPVRYHSVGGRLCCFVVDRSGKLCIGRHNAGRWVFDLGSPGTQLAPRLTDRQVSRNPRQSVQLKLTNTFREPLRVEIQNLLEPTTTHTQIELPVGESVSQTVEIDMGATVQDTYEVPVPGGVPQVDVRTYQQPPLPSQKFVVWKTPVVSRIINSNPRIAKNIPNSERRGLVSLGVFVLQPIKDVTKETEILVYEQASRARNPGAPEFQGRQRQ